MPTSPENQKILANICQALENEFIAEKFSTDNLKKNQFRLQKIVRRFPRDDNHGQNPFFSKSDILKFYHQDFSSTADNNLRNQIIKLLQVKPIRTQSGVATITILTKPYPCPGTCIFCPADIRMPKSYLNSEPGAQRAEMNFFDPYLQTISRLINLDDMGHKIDKIELIILGGTWTAYPETYRIWFIEQALKALNDFKENIILPQEEKNNQLSSKNQDNPSLAQIKAENLNQKAIIAKNCEEREAFYLNYQKNIAAADHKVLSQNKAQNAQTFALDQADLAAGDQLNYNQMVNKLYIAPEKEFGLAAYQTATWEQLQKQQLLNENAYCHNVGLVIETRPDEISITSLTQIRALGCTKIQIGVQSVDDKILAANKRGTTTTQIKMAFALTRLYGFKIHVHFMANLYTATPAGDIADFQKLFTDPAYKPDELKMYPCSLIESAPLIEYYKSGLWSPYSEAELMQVLIANLLDTPDYCRLTRMIRDISSNDIVVGNKKTNFRQMVDDQIKKSGGVVKEIRSREIKNQTFTEDDLILNEIKYETHVSTEYFLQFVTKKDYQIAGFLRLSLPHPNIIDDFLTDQEKEKFPAELINAAIIREIHVYGAVAGVGEKNNSQQAQHLGLGTRLIKAAQKIVIQANQDISIDRSDENKIDQSSKKVNYYQNIAVISALGTKDYYRKKGFIDGGFYQHLNLV